LKNKNQIFEKKYFQFFLYGEKDNCEEYFLNLAYVKLNFLILINYSASKCPQTTVMCPGFGNPNHCKVGQLPKEIEEKIG
jgi:hypothetical protein